MPKLPMDTGKLSCIKLQPRLTVFGTDSILLDIGDSNIMPKRQEGLLSISSRPPDYEPGDLVVVAQNAWPGLRSLQLPRGQRMETSVERFVPSWPVNTITCDGGANFYGNRLAFCERPTLLPFALGHFTSEEFLFYRILKPAEEIKAATAPRQGIARSE